VYVAEVLLLLNNCLQLRGRVQLHNFCYCLLELLLKFLQLCRCCYCLIFISLQQ
jgi:hypothetical protein